MGSSHAPQTIPFPLTLTLFLRERILRNFSPIEPLNQWKTSNIQHPTSNIQHRMPKRSKVQMFFGCSALDVRRWMLDVPGGSWGGNSKDPSLKFQPCRIRRPTIDKVCGGWGALAAYHPFLII